MSKNILFIQGRVSLGFLESVHDSWVSVLNNKLNELLASGSTILFDIIVFVARQISSSIYTGIKLDLFWSTTAISSEQFSWITGSIRGPSFLLFVFFTVLSFSGWLSLKTLNHSCFSSDVSARKQRNPAEEPIRSPCGVRVKDISSFSVTVQDFNRRNARGFLPMNDESV